jgi:hypothetical protein
MKVCECGCGQRVLVRYGVPLRFIHGHQNGTPKRRPDWPAEMVAFLVREKRRGQLTYEAAWKLALLENPPGHGTWARWRRRCSGRRCRSWSSCMRRRGRRGTTSRR